MKILRLTSSIKAKDSMSWQLGNAIMDRIKKQNLDVEVTTRNLVKNEIPHFSEQHLAAFMTATDALSSDLQAAISFSDQAIQELQAADVVVVEVPMYNFGIPSSLKAWIDHIARAGVTFRYTENGVEGLVKDKKVILAIATGGIYSDGPMQEFDFTEKYLKAVLGFVGLTDIVTFRVEGTALPGIGETALAKAIEAVEAHQL